MQKYLEDRGEVTFDEIFTQKIGELEAQGLQGTGWGAGEGTWMGTHKRGWLCAWASGGELGWWQP